MHIRSSSKLFRRIVIFGSYNFLKTTNFAKETLSFLKKANFAKETLNLVNLFILYFHVLETVCFTDLLLISSHSIAIYFISEIFHGMLA